MHKYTYTTNPRTAAESALHNTIRQGSATLAIQMRLPSLGGISICIRQLSVPGTHASAAHNNRSTKPVTPLPRMQAVLQAQTGRRSCRATAPHSEAAVSFASREGRHISTLVRASQERHPMTTHWNGTWQQLRQCTEQHRYNRRQPVVSAPSTMTQMTN